ncbi:hypothetical protein [Micromonospora sp. CPCC 206061]|uniref:hypothetical protein n=1 Tax=Micromonospora sp. CPCC 206061 TaxID=3122410 RepID=UPI002FEFEDAC
MEASAGQAAEPSGRTLSWLDEDGPEPAPVPMDFTPLPPPVPPPEPPPPEGGSRAHRRPRRILLVAAFGAIVLVIGTAATALLVPRLTGPPPQMIAAPGDVVSTQIGSRTDAEFDLVTGTTTVNIKAADLGTDLYRISTPRGANGAPRPVHRGKIVELHIVPSGQDGPGAIDIQLSSKLPWRVRLTGGAATHALDLRAGSLLGLDLIGGATRVDLSLPPPKGTVPLKLTGGVNQLSLHAPRDVPTRVRVGGGASNVTLDRFNRASPSPGTVFTPNGWSRGADRYDIDAVAGVATLRLDRTPP